MSNKIVPTVYRSIVDDVMSNIRSEFEEFGIDGQVLHDLQSRWELKIIHSNVADFEKPAGGSGSSRDQQQQQAQQQQQHHAQQQQQQQHLQQPPNLPNAYGGLPPLPGPPPPSHMAYAQQMNQMNQLPPLAGPPPPSGPYSRNGQLPPPPVPPYGLNDHLASRSDSPHQLQHRIPQLDGPSNASSGEDDSGSSDGSPSPPNKSVPLPSIRKAPAAAAAPNGSGGSGGGPSGAGEDASALDDDDAVIGSDLDDTDDDDNGDQDDEEVEGGSKVLCTYDRVQRVKNKWKCTLKDGMVHINGKDYLFSKCTGEFEW